MLRDEFTAALKTAMLAKEEKTVAALRMITAKVKDADIAALSEETPIEEVAEHIKDALPEAD